MITFQNMKQKSPEYEYPIEGIAQVGKPGEPAAIYTLHGCWHLAAFDSVGEAMLQLSGALHVATLSFPTRVPALN